MVSNALAKSVCFVFHSEDIGRYHLLLSCEVVEKGVFLGHQFLGRGDTLTGRFRTCIYISRSLASMWSILIESIRLFSVRLLLTPSSYLSPFF